MQFAGFPRVRLAHLPTPLEEMKNFSKALDGPRLFVKRDDSTGLGFGGNKIRKLEFLMGEALERKADTVITTGGVQSNHARQTAAAAKKLGMEAILLLRGEQPEEGKGNLLLDRILGAQVRFVQASDFLEVDQAAYELGSELEASGKRPYVIPLGGSTPTGSLGYAAAALEIVGQIQEMGLRVDTVVVANGSAGTQAGLVLGFKALNSGILVIGISVSRSRDALSAQVLDLGNRTAEKLGVEIRLDPEDVVVYQDYVGAGYAIPTKEGVAAIKLLARTEGLFLDPVYTSKAMAGLIDLIGKGVLKKEQNVLFMHTGGSPGLFVDEGIFE
ncbi:MAG: D-cysteine desulfhydrase [Candidatus Latescibacteria bacterium]|nr:D-cysteine desulfhydrase [Candidatus Latescibacterota bacterium]